nr:reverse transcriptase domain-containing protein [Tanacetum cinerariifolium]
MSTRSSARNLFPPLDNPELTIRRRSRSDLTLLNNSEMAAEGNNDLPVPDLRTMEELCQPSLNGRAAGGTFMKRRPEECYDLIENMTAHHNDLDTSAQRSESSSSITFSSDTETAALKAEMAKINKNLMRPSLAILKTYMMQELTKVILTNHKATEATKDTVHPTNSEITEDVQPPVVPIESSILNSEPVISPTIEPVASPVSASKPNLRPSIPYPSRLQDQKLYDKAND